MSGKLLTGILALFLISGCAGNTKELQMKDKTIVFPNGTLFGGASKEQASTLAQIFVDSHNMASREMGEIREISSESLKNRKESLKSREELKKSMQKLEDTTEQMLETDQKNAEIAQRSLQKNYETAQSALRMLEQLSKSQGTGEITIFFPLGASRVGKGSLEYERLVRFTDYLARESRGRKILFISIGSASATGDRKTNRKLAKNRSEFPVETIDKYLVNIPHEFYKVYGTGDVYSPKNVTMKEHERYQNTRIVAVFETDQAPPQLPAPPEEPAGK